MNSLWDEIFTVLKPEERTYLMEHESKALLAREGLPVAASMVAKTTAEAVEKSKEIGYPVVLKVLSPNIMHKSDLGGVKLNLRNAAEVELAYTEIIEAFPDKQIAGVAVQKMESPGLEAIVGISNDPTFGPVLMFGLGGVFVEVLQDVTFRILPLTEEDIEDLVKEIRGYRLLQGYRGKAIDLSALKDLLGKVSDLVLKYPQIKELDLNPVFLYPEGNIIVDARIFLQKKEKYISAHAPYKKKKSLKNFFYPDSIAVLGASDKKGKLGWNVFHNLSQKFAGKLYPINNKTKTIQGFEALSSIDEVKEPVDLAIILVPANQSLQAFEECCQAGIKNIIIESAGFAETGENGKNMEKEFQRLAKRYGCQFVGPNCSGIINTHHNMVQSIGIVSELRKGNVGLIAQAGVYAAGMLWGIRHITDFAIIATIGNKADINETDILEYLGEDDNVEVICMYLEDIKSGRRFIDVARKVSARKPVFILKSGRTEAGKKAVSSHTASMAGNDLIYDAAFRQAGIIRVRNNDHMFGLARAFSKQPLPSGDGVMVISYTGSLGVAAADALSLSKMRLGKLSTETCSLLRGILPPYVGCNNPVDFTFDMNAAQVKNTIEIGLRCKDIDSFIVILQAEILDTYIQEFNKIDFQGKPILCCVPCREFVMTEVIQLEQAGFPVYSTPEEAVEALAVMNGFKRKKGGCDQI